MVNFHDPAVIARENWTLVMLWHVLSGLYLWEFVTTLDYEWMVIRGRVPYRWTIWVYSTTRIAALVTTILGLVGMDTATLHCQLWFAFIMVFSHIAVGGASLLIALRVMAIWTRNKAVMATIIIIWGIDVGFLILGAAQLRTVRLPTGFCKPVHTDRNLPAIIAMAVTDITLLLIMLVGLRRIRRESGCTYGLTKFIWKQGIIWIFLAAVAAIPPAVLLILNLNDELNVMLQVPSLFTVIIAATRMYRSLEGYASGRLPDETAHANVQTSDIVFSNGKRAQAISIPFNRREPEVSVNVDIESPLSSQMNSYGCSVNTNDKRPNDSHPDDTVGCGV